MCYLSTKITTVKPLYTCPREVVSMLVAVACFIVEVKNSEKRRGYMFLHGTCSCLIGCTIRTGSTVGTNRTQLSDTLERILSYKMCFLSFQHWPELAEDLHPYFVTFPTDSRIYQRPVTSMSKKEIPVSMDKSNGIFPMAGIVFEILLQLLMIFALVHKTG